MIEDNLFTIYVETGETLAGLNLATPLNLNTFPELWDTLSSEAQKNAALNLLVKATQGEQE